MSQKLGILDLSKRWNLSKAAVQKMIERKQLPAQKISNFWIIDIDDVHEFEEIKRLKIFAHYGIGGILDGCIRTTKS